MKRYDNTLLSKLAGLDFNTLEECPGSVFGLSKDFEFIYFNPAWFSFAAMNDGEPGISIRFTLGTPIESAITGTLKEFYIRNYKEALESKTVWKHEYECSSPTIYRLFCQDVYPLKNGEGLIVVNSIKVEKLISDDLKATSTHPINDYLDSNRFIVQCSNCRRTQRSKQPDIWDWVPMLVKNMPKNVSHSICPICYDYYWKYYKL